MSADHHSFHVFAPPRPDQREAWLSTLESLASRALPKLIEIEAMVTECEPATATRELSELVSFLRGKYP